MSCNKSWEFVMLPILIDRYETDGLKSKYLIIRSLEDLFGLLLVNNLDA